MQSLSLSITRPLNAWLDSLKKTKAVGHRHQTAEKRETLGRGRRRDEFLDYLKQVIDGQDSASNLSRRDPEPSK